VRAALCDQSRSALFPPSGGALGAPAGDHLLVDPHLSCLHARPSSGPRLACCAAGARRRVEPRARSALVVVARLEPQCRLPHRRPHPQAASSEGRAGSAEGIGAMTDALLAVNGLGKRFGGFVALEDIDLEVMPGERVGLIGPNGSGKSTLVNCICGTLKSETGTVRFSGETVDGLLTHERTRRGLARSFQLPRPFTTLTVTENLRVPLLYTVNARPGRALSPTELDARCAELLQLVALADKGTHLPRDLTQVEMRKLELAR